MQPCNLFNYRVDQTQECDGITTRDNYSVGVSLDDRMASLMAFSVNNSGLRDISEVPKTNGPVFKTASEETKLKGPFTISCFLWLVIAAPEFLFRAFQALPSVEKQKRVE